ncbi:hypothetical protein K1X76_07885 [bacterium]|nr:hypothetical protein [bacterium]
MSSKLVKTILFIWLIITSFLGLYHRVNEDSLITSFHTRWGMLSFPLIAFFIVNFIKRSVATKQEVYSLYALLATGLMAWLTGLAHDMEFLPLGLHQLFVVGFSLLTLRYLFSRQSS